MTLFFSLLASIIIGFLGFLVFFHDSKNVTNRIFFIHSLVISAWSIVNYVSIVMPPERALVWIRLVLFLAVPHVFLFFLFVLNFPSNKLEIRKNRLAGLLALMLAMMVLTLTRGVFSSVNVVSGQAVPVPGMLIPVFGGILVLVSLITLYLIGRKYSRSAGIEKKQWQTISIGLIFAYTLLLGLVFLPVAISGNTQFVNYSSVFVLPIFLATSYAILRHKLMNVKVVATEILAFFLIFVSVWQTLLARTAAAVLLQVLISTLLLIFSILLIRSVLNEVRSREQLQDLSAKLEEANKQLKILDEAKSEFLSVTSHQLRTPITAIKGYASMFMEGDFGQLAPEQMKNMQIIYDSTERLVHLIADLLDLSRIESGKMEFDFKAVDLCKIVDDVLRELTPKAQERKLHLFFDNINRSCPEIRADDEKIRQVVINLIDNAIKYTVSGGVTVRLIKVGSDLQFSVSDTGIGVAEQDKGKLFEKFFRAEAAVLTTHEGTGLGIYVVKKIVEAHGGRIWFDSPGINKGTTFYVTLPIPTGAIKEEQVKISSLEAF